MKTNLFSEAVKKEFSFLAEDLEYNIIQEITNLKRRVCFGHFLSRHTTLIIVQDRGQVLINLGEASKPRND